LVAWTKDMDNYYKNIGQPIPENINWKVFGDIILASKYYE